MADRLIRTTTALAVVAVAAIIAYQHAHELVRSHGESGLTARLVPFTVDGLIWAASMLILDANRRRRPVPSLASWCLGAGIVATTGANLAHGLGHGPIGALVSAGASRFLRVSGTLPGRGQAPVRAALGPGRTTCTGVETLGSLSVGGRPRGVPGALADPLDDELLVARLPCVPSREVARVVSRGTTRSGGRRLSGPGTGRRGRRRGRA